MNTASSRTFQLKTKLILLAALALVTAVWIYYKITDPVIGSRSYQVQVAGFIPAHAYKDPSEAEHEKFETWIEYIDRRDPQYWRIWNATELGEFRRVQTWYPNWRDPKSEYGQWGAAEGVETPGNGRIRQIKPERVAELQRELNLMLVEHEKQSVLDILGRKKYQYPNYLSDHNSRRLSEELDAAARRRM
jgi:hypothetical protein